MKWASDELLFWFEGLIPKFNQVQYLYMIGYNNDIKRLLKEVHDIWLKRNI